MEDPGRPYQAGRQGMGESWRRGVTDRFSVGGKHSCEVYISLTQ